MLPGLFVFAGMFLNFTLNSITNLNVINHFGQLLPWATYLAMPALLKKNACDSETLWRYFYYFMLTAAFLGLSEYFLVISGKLSTRIMSIPGGEFLVGRFSILRFMKGFIPYPRLYACFAEPGTLAMFLIPVIAYAYFYKKYIGLSIFLLAIFFSQSLGGIIAIAIMIPLLVFLFINKRKVSLAISITLLILFSSAIVICFKAPFTVAYERKKSSATNRELNIKNTIINLLPLFVNNPIGFELEEGTASDSKNPYYYGSSFALGHIFQMGGISAFLGYSVILLVSVVVSFLRIIPKNLSLEEKVVFTSLIVLFPFIFQRKAVWDSTIFAFLFVPSIINFLRLHGRVSLYPGAVRSERVNQNETEIFQHPQ